MTVPFISRMLSTRNCVRIEASNSKSADRDSKILVDRDTIYSGKIRREMRARMIVVNDFSDHSVER